MATEDHSKQLILIVDDQAVLRRAMSHLLRRYGAIEIHEASDGRAALAIVQDPSRSIDIMPMLGRPPPPENSAEKPSLA